MKEYPILFSGPMVRAILEGRKTMTRRLDRRWLKVKKGDRLWVRESFYAENREIIHYRADSWQYEDNPSSGWTASIFMPRWASRITLEATADARLERLRQITNQDISDEGIEGLHPCGGAFPNQWRERFAKLWDSLNPKAPWSSNPEVVVLEFKEISP